jgi:hypothetical protein
MSDKIFKKSELPLRRTVDLLPDVFKTSTNDKFLSTTLDALVQPGALERLSGFIGRRYGKSFNSNDTYLDVEKSLRSSYQFEPGVVLESGQKVKKLYDYIDFKNQLKFFNNVSERDDLATYQDQYSWNPPIDWDKFINYREYYWLPVGPEIVSIAGQAETVISKYRVRSDGQNEWLFYPDGLKRNPQITLYRGQTYIFEVNSPGDPFLIRSGNLKGDQENYNKGVTNNGIEVGTITFEVPLDSPELLYYQSGTNINRVGSFVIASVLENSFINVEKEILGKVNYTSSNNVKLTNGLKIEFIGKVEPSIYKGSLWLVEGVGESIKLINFAELEIPPIASTDIEVTFDDGGFDTLPFDDASAYPTQKDYITINRASNDKNPWSRYNRWFHRSVIDYAADINKVSPSLSENERAKRPIIEFLPNTQLFDHGYKSKKSVDLIDDFTKDVFSTIEGSAGYNIDGQSISDGDRILFLNDPDPFVKNKIFEVKFIQVQTGSNILNRTQISLIEASDSEPSMGEAVIVVKGSEQNKGRMYHFDGVEWKKSQTKTSINQFPLFDLFDSDGVSFSDNQKYETSTFSGTEIISYKKGNGPVDKELGFSLSYLNINNTGDILFEVDFEKDSFLYQNLGQTVTKLISSGFYKNSEKEEYYNGWIKTNPNLRQPIIETTTLESNTNTIISSACIWTGTTNEHILFYINGNKFGGEYTSNINGDTRTFVFDQSFEKGVAITLKIYTDDQPNLGYYEIPNSLEKNPLNQNLEKFTLGQANDHLRTMIEVDTAFQGEFPGASNLRDISNYRQNGSRFMKRSSLGILSFPLLCDRNVNLIKSISHAATEYEKFKNNFITIAGEIEYDQNSIVELVDNILDKMSKSNIIDFPYATSDMIGSGAYKVIKYEVEDEGIKTFALSEKFDLDTISSKAVYVYVNDNQLLHGSEYEFDSTFGFIKLLVNLNEGDKIEIREYLSTAYSFIPETPTKLGLYKKFTPKIYLDTTLLDPSEVIQGHDGSIIISFGDLRDDAILELEKRIYNNIKIKYDPSIFDIDRLSKGYYGIATYNSSDVDAIIEPDFLKWANNLGIDIYKNDVYQAENSFTYTYFRAVDRNKRVKIPQFWRGIYKFLYDTDRPHICPWEMLGFSEKPTWWEDEYGPAPYTLGNLLLWEDLEQGMIRQGPTQGINPRYARPRLLDFIPVDDHGNLRSPQDASAIIDYSLNRINEDFQFGDYGPVENSWRRSSLYPFSLISAASLLTPIEFISTNFDRNKISKNILGQLVDKDTGAFINKQTLKASLENPAGLFTYIQNYLKFTALDVSLLADTIDSMDVRMSHKIGGFVEKERQRYILDSKSPTSKSPSVFIPPEDYQVFFNTSTVVKSVSYSGVIVEKVDGGFKIFGYDRLNSYFNTYEPYTRIDDPILSVGGVSEKYVEWDAEKYYGKGALVRYQGLFYRCTANHVAGNSFQFENFTSLPALPIVGAVEAIKRTAFNKILVKRIPYNSIVNTIQQVVDIILGYSEWLKDQGLVFDDYNKDLSVPNDWELSAQEFMFWTSHNWAIGALITLSPAATLLKITNVGSVADNILDNFYEYNIFRNDGTKIPVSDIQVYRGYNEFVLTPLDINETGIYFAKINFVQKEHVAVFNDRTMFGDVIYDKSPGYRQERIKLIGFRTTDWDGDYTSPGFIYDSAEIQPWQSYKDYKLGDIVQFREYYYVSKIPHSASSDFNFNNWERLDSSPEATLITNIDYKINQIEDYYEVGYQGIDETEKELARHSIGYQKRSYLEDIAQDEVTQFRIYQGFIREKGTKNSITKIFDKLSKIDQDSIELKEEWAFWMGSFGGSAQFKELEILLDQKNIRLNPQPVIIDSRGLSKTNFQNYILTSINDFTIGNQDFVFPTKFYKSLESSAGYVYSGDVDFIVKTRDNLYALDITQLSDGSRVWVTFDTIGWSVLRYTITDVIIGAVAVVDSTSVTLECNKPHGLKVDDIIGINNIRYLEGFWRVKAVDPNTIIIEIAGFDEEPVIDQSSFATISIFETLRVGQYSDLISDRFAAYKEGTRVWLDDNGEGKWEVLEKKRIYKPVDVANYGVAFPTGSGKDVLFLEARNQIISSNPGQVVPAGEVIRESAVVVYGQSEEGLIPLQILNPNSNLRSIFLGSYGEVLATSKDGRWLMVGSPTVSYIPSNYKEVFSPSATYNPGDTVLFAGKLYQAQTTVVGDGSTINIDSQDWKPATEHLANPLGIGLYDVNQGYRQQGALEIFEYDEIFSQYQLRHTIISPRPAHGEKFSSTISLSKREGIEGTSGDVTLTVASIDSVGGILEVSAQGESGLADARFSNVSGSDISLPGSNATFDVQKTNNTYSVLVRTGGSRYAIGDRIKITGSNLLGLTPFNDLIITVTAVTSTGEIVGSATYNNIKGINSILPDEEATFRVTKSGNRYAVTRTSAGSGYSSRSIVRYSGRLYACIKDTRIDLGVWNPSRTYQPGDVVKYPANSTAYYTATGLNTGIVPTDVSKWENTLPIFPTNQEYWEQVSGAVFAETAVEWADLDLTGNKIRYTAGSVIVIPGSELGGEDGEHNITIRVNLVTTNSAIDNFSYRGTASSGIIWSGTATAGERQFNDLQGEDVSDPGQGAIFDLVREDGRYNAIVNVAGTRYNVGDQIRILGSTLGGVEEAYYMVVGAPGSKDDMGRAYLYKFDGVGWKHLDDPNFVGIYSSTKNYPLGSRVWYNSDYWQALSNIPAVPNNQPGTGNWEKIAEVTNSIFPPSLAYADDGSTIQQPAVGDIEFLNIGSSYGTFSAFNKDGSVMIISAPANDTASFENFKGVWRNNINYLAGDTVRRGTFYYNCLADNINSIPEFSPSIWQENSDSTLGKTGSVFVYEKTSNETFTLIQTIDSDDVELEAGDEFGHKVVLNQEGTRLFVSAPNFDYLGKDQGSVFVFDRTASGFALKQKLNGLIMEPGERFGSNVSVSPDGITLAISAEGAASYKTTIFDRGNTAFDRFVTRFRDSQGKTGKVYVYTNYTGSFVLSEILDQGLNTDEDFGRGLSVSNNSIIVGSPSFISEDPAFEAVRIGRLQKFDKIPNSKPWFTIRQQVPQVNIDLLKTFSFYDKFNNLKIADVDIVDPYKGKVLSIVDQFIDFKTSFDPAVYSIGTDNSAVDSSQSWQSNKVGLVWWDLSTAKWTLYEQGSLSFRNGNWGTLAVGSSIDVYEWVETPFKPSEWNALAGSNEGFAEGVSGTALYGDDSNYSVKITLDVNTNSPSNITYYYWVKNKTTVSSTSNKTFSVNEISNYISNPSSAGVPYVLLTSENTFSLVNLTSVIDRDEFLVNVQFYETDKETNLIHNEYQLLSEGSLQLPNRELENKWIDSLIGEDIAGQSVPDRKLPEKLRYGISSRPRQSMFVNRNNAVNLTIEFINNILNKKPFAEIIDYGNLNLQDEEPALTKNLYDQVLETEKELRFIATSKIKTAKLKANIVNGHINTVDVIDGGYGYKIAPDIKIVGSGSGAKFKPTLDNRGSITSVEVINQGKKYLTASLIVRPFSVLVKTDSTVNNFWSIYSLDEKNKEFYRSATQAFDTKKFWKKVDWWTSPYNEKSKVKKTIAGLYEEASVSLNIGDLLRLENYGIGGWAILERVDGSQADILNKYRLVGRKLGTIQLINGFYNTDSESTGYDLTQAFDSNKYDTSASTEFRNILTAVKEDIFKEELAVEWNNLFFVSLRYVFSEQLYVDWAFKTSFINATHNVGNLEQKLNYKNDNLSSYQSYIEEVKPYRTKIRNYISKYFNLETANQLTTDFDLPPVWNSETSSVDIIGSNSNQLSQYPWKLWVDNNHYSVIDIKIVSPGKNYSSVPQIVFDGGNGTGAQAQAYISNGKISKIVVTNPGSGYISAPTVMIVGGVGSEIQNAARAVAIIGDSKVRTFDMKMKFDRISKTPKFKSYSFNEKFIEIETFNASAKQTTYKLKYPLSLDKSTITVTLDGSRLLSSQYSVTLTEELINSKTELIGRLILNSAPDEGSAVVIEYQKNNEILDSLNRIDKYYKPKDGQLGVEKTRIDDTEGSEVVSDYSQLITGIDYGGTIVQGATFDIGAGWDALPWFTEGWDSSEVNETDFYFLVDGSTTSVLLPEVPKQGIDINIYVKRASTGKTVRLDFETYNEYQLGDSSYTGEVPPDTAIMNTFVGDGSTASIIIPQAANLESGDLLIFRPSTSDGSLVIGGRNSIDAYISGGSLSGMSAYSTATGTTAAEIVLDGDRFISPEQVPAPEENVPGQVLEALSIKVFHSSRSGSSAVKSKIYIADGNTIIFDIGQKIIEKTNILVFVDKFKKDIDTEFVILSENNSIRFIGTTPTAGSVIEIFTMGTGGKGILDYREFTGTGNDRYFITGASFNETVTVFASVDNQPVDVGFINSAQLTDTQDKTLVEFGVAPTEGSRIVLIALNTDQRPLVKINQVEIPLDEAIKEYAIPTFSGLDIDPAGDMLVEINGELLRTVETTYKIYDGNNNIQIGVDTPRDPGTVIFTDLKVFVDNQLKTFGIDFTFTSENNTVTFIKPVTLGAVIRIEDSSGRQYSIADTNIVLEQFTEYSTGDTLSITWFERYTELDIVKDEFVGGKVSFSLQRPLIGISYVWVYKNGIRLTPDIDFYVELPRAIYLRQQTTESDIIETISFGDRLYKQPLSFEIFKDVLNRNHYNRYRVLDLKLDKDFNYFDNEITLVDASPLATPSKDQPGIITIQGEKIQYYEKIGNVLKNIRRGLFGTAIRAVYPKNTLVVDTGFLEFIPYQESQEKEDFISDGTSLLVGPLNFLPGKANISNWYRNTIPANFGRCDEIEVFVGGRRLRKDATKIYDSTVGAYSPAGDIDIEAEFSVDGINENIRLTYPVPAGTRITVIRRQGRLWYDRGASTATTGQGLSYSNTAIAKFLQNSSTKLP